MREGGREAWDLRVPWENSHRKEHYHGNPTLIKYGRCFTYLFILLYSCNNKDK